MQSAGCHGTAMGDHLVSIPPPTTRTLSPKHPAPLPTAAVPHAARHAPLMDCRASPHACILLHSFSPPRRHLPCAGLQRPGRLRGSPACAPSAERPGRRAVVPRAAAGAPAAAIDPRVGTQWARPAAAQRVPGRAAGGRHAHVMRGGGCGSRAAAQPQGQEEKEGGAGGGAATPAQVVSRERGARGESEGAALCVWGAMVLMHIKAGWLAGAWQRCCIISAHAAHQHVRC